MDIRSSRSSPEIAPRALTNVIAFAAAPLSTFKSATARPDPSKEASHEYAGMLRGVLVCVCIESALALAAYEIWQLRHLIR